MKLKLGERGRNRKYGESLTLTFLFFLNNSVLALLHEIVQGRSPWLEGGL